MRKVISLLDDEQCEALSVLVDTGAAIFSAGLIVALIHALVDLVA